MAAEDSLSDPSLTKWPSRGSRVVCKTLSRSDSQQKAPEVGGKSKKDQQRSGNEIFVCLAPRYLLSPGAEKVRYVNRRKSYSGPIFFIPRPDEREKKQDHEIQEPTSPTVSCIGQVRANKKTGHTITGEDSQTQLQQSKTGWASPKRFLTSRSRQYMKWKSFFCSRKEETSPLDVSICSDLALDSPSSSQVGKRENGAFSPGEMKSHRNLAVFAPSKSQDRVEVTSDANALLVTRRKLRWLTVSVSSKKRSGPPPSEAEFRKKKRMKGGEERSSELASIEERGGAGEQEDPVLFTKCDWEALQISLDVVPETWLCQKSPTTTTIM